jgi:2-keto-4-pentenoate hydratase/2-oxohepta-3-ene-1,7-dioic acid hydratase in catechol pathway
MNRTARLALGTLILVACAAPVDALQSPAKYVRYTHGAETHFGILDGETIRELEGDMFGTHRPTGALVPLADVRLLPPTVPSKVIAVGLNYQSHLGERAPAAYPGLFAKFPTSIVGTGDEIIIPEDSEDLHYEGELVIVVGERARNVSEEDAHRYIFGVTAGNDISERSWQAADLQWFRAKGSDTFGPIGPAVVTGLDYNDLLVQTRLNGEVMQSESSEDLLFNIDFIVSYVSRYVTLEPGDVIFTGTPGSTSAMKDGDVVEVEVAGVGVLRNTVVAAYH